MRERQTAENILRGLDQLNKAWEAWEAWDKDLKPGDVFSFTSRYVENPLTRWPERDALFAVLNMPGAQE